MDKSDFKIALKEIPDDKWYVGNSEKTMYYVYEDSFTLTKDGKQETFCTLDIRNLRNRFGAYLIVELTKNFRIPNFDTITSSTVLFGTVIFDPILRRKYRKIYKNILKERKRRDAIEKKKTNMQELPKSLIRSLNIEKFLED